MNIDQTARNKIIKARTGMILDQPFFGTLAMRLDIVEDRSIKTLDVDGKRVRYNPDFVNTLDSDLAKSAMAHEVMHCVLQHCGANGRGINLDPAKWGHAVDYATNAIIKEAGFKLGDGWLYDPQYAGMSAEQIYAMIPTPPPGDGSAPNGQNPGPIDQHSPGSPDPAMQAADAADWKVATTQAANAAKAQGKLPASMEHLVEKLKENKVDWQAELRHFISRAAKGDYSWQRPNRVMQAAGFILPGLYSEEMGTIVIAADESGSVDPTITAAFGAEINAIKEDMRPEKITLMHFDSEVGKTEEFGPDDAFQMVRYCSGGTDFRPAIEAAQELTTPPLCMVFLTDLYGPFPPSPPEFPVLWVTINDEVAPFGDTLHIEI